MKPPAFGGNLYDKYQSRNPIARLLMAGFLRAFDRLVGTIRNDVGCVVDAGCGEGYMSRRVALSCAASVLAFDVSPRVVEMAQRLNPHPEVTYAAIDLLTESERVKPADLVLCLEVLEHLEKPELALEQLHGLTTAYAILSVPNEPIWRALNVARGKYLGALGNTPGHLQHWSPERFRKLISCYFDIVSTEAPLPWTMVLCRK